VGRQGWDILVVAVVKSHEQFVFYIVLSRLEVLRNRKTEKSIAPGMRTYFFTVYKHFCNLCCSFEEYIHIFVFPLLRYIYLFPVPSLSPIIARLIVHDITVVPSMWDIDRFPLDFLSCLWNVLQCSFVEIPVAIDRVGYTLCLALERQS